MNRKLLLPYTRQQEVSQKHPVHRACWEYASTKFGSHMSIFAPGLPQHSNFLVMTKLSRIGALVTVESIFHRSGGNIRHQKNGWQVEMHFGRDSVKMYQSWAENGFHGSSRKAQMQFDASECPIPNKKKRKKKKNKCPCHELKTWHTAETNKTMLRLMLLFHCILSIWLAVYWTKCHDGY